MFPQAAKATIIDIPDDYNTIQEGINHGAYGDTVLVQPDTYQENLNFNGHNVVLGSLFLTTGDTLYISNTIIDGGRRNSVITLEDGEDSTAQVVGFTIQNGGGAYVEGGGILCSGGSNPIISYNMITRDSAGIGGGIYCYYSSPRISNNTISDNVVTGGGAGIYCYTGSHPVINHNTITANRARTGSGAGIYCYNNASPTITDNDISGNSAASSGGGIFGQESNAIISGNRITGNSAPQGGGVDWPWYGTPTMSNNIISGNTAGTGGGIFCGSNCDAIIDSNEISGNSTTSKGGGIYCYSCSPTISNNTISGNWASSYNCEGGGGIYLRSNCHPVISDNVITANWTSGDWAGNGGAIQCYDQCSPEITGNSFGENSASHHGGAIDLEYSSNPTITHCSFDRNSAGANGGGIRCRYSAAPTVTNCTFSANVADISGGGIDCDWWFSSPMANCILWGNTALNGPQIYVPEGAPDPTVTYCDVQGGWAGQGNIDSDPLLVCPERGDLNIRWRSPCIDAGDPNSPLDPDGTCADIGALYFDQDVIGLIELYPHDTPIVIPPEGGDIIYDGWVFNFFGHPGRVDIWTYAFVPEMGQYGPLDLYENVRIPADSLGMNGITEHVPGAAPEGDYVFVAYVGDYPSTIIDSSYFCFTKSGSVGSGMTGWFDGDGWFKERSLTESNLPTAYDLSQNYLNPFNANTAISYQVPVEGHVKLEVYNTLGQKVATLVNSKQQAGYRSVVWDARGVSSGVYFCRLSAGRSVFTERMILLK
jgi:parallel beta-helix repeat protein